ncbi:unnamed protein product [Sphagnum balticum]
MLGEAEMQLLIAGAAADDTGVKFLPGGQDPPDHSANVHEHAQLMLIYREKGEFTLFLSEFMRHGVAYLMRNVLGEAEEFDYMFKLIIVGSSAVGKSNILSRFTKNQFNEVMGPTVGVEYATKKLINMSGKKVKLQIWDTAGQEKYK